MGADLERAALSYATNGFAVFPLTPAGKRPLHKGWQKEATDDPVLVHGYWQKTPLANVGVRCGDGLVVIDADRPGSLDRLELPATTMVKTSRGVHVYLDGHTTNYIGVLPGVDVRGRGGFVAGAGSIHASGARYEWLTPPWEVAPQPIPAHVLELLKRRPKRSSGEQIVIAHGCRNATLTAVAGRLRRMGLSEAELAAALQEMNTLRCQPPLPRAEVRTIARSIGAKDGPPEWLVDPLRFASDQRLSLKGQHLLTVLALRAKDDGSLYGGEWLQDAAGMSRNSVSRALAELERHGRAKVTRRARMANVIRLEDRRAT